MGTYPSQSSLSIHLSTILRNDTGNLKSVWLPSAEYYARLNREFAALLERAVERSDASHADIAAVRQICGLTRHCRPYGNPMSNLRMRRRAARLLYRKLRPLWLANPSRVWGFGTFIPDLGNSLEYGPHVELGRLKRDVSKMLRAVNMQAIGVVELQLGRFPLGEHGRTVQAHIHTLGYLDGPIATLGSAVKILAKRSASQNWLGAHVADFQPVSSLKDLRHWCRYMLKAPLAASFLRSDIFKRSGFETASRDLTDPSGALMLAQILSGMTLRNATLAHGQLLKAKGDWIRRMSRWAAAHPARTEPGYPHAFQQVWAQSLTKKARANPVVRLDAKAPTDERWRDAMALLISTVNEHQKAYDVRRQRSCRARR